MNIEDLSTPQVNVKVVSGQRQAETSPGRADVCRSGMRAVEPLMSASAMAYPQLGYPYAPTHQFLMSPSSLASCLEPGGRSLVDTLSPPAHAALSCPVFESRVLGSPGHELTPAAGIGVYSGAYAKSQGYYSTCVSDATALYSRGTLDSKDSSASAHVGASQSPAYYPYDYAFGQYPYDRYGYASADGASRRKNATRETTSTLKAWLQEHQKNPYPTKGEKIMLAIITKMTLTQVSTWFANARRRLKKENKVTWSPRANKSSDERGCDDDSDGGEQSPEDQPIKSERDLADTVRCSDLQQSDLEDFDLLESDGSDCEPKQHFHAGGTTTRSTADRPPDPSSHAPLSLVVYGHPADALRGDGERSSANFPKPAPAELDPRGAADGKPKIWSIAQTAVSMNPAVQPEYPPCMLSSAEVSYPGYTVNMGLTAAAERQQDSAVETLREWVDGVFHNPPLFQQQRPGSQTPSRPTAMWKGLSGAAAVETLGRSFEHVSSSLQQA